LNLTDEETTVLISELTDITFGAHYFRSPRIKTLEAILATLRQQRPRQSSPPTRIYEPPSKGRYKRR
jgi:hypothetical protein